MPKVQCEISVESHKKVKFICIEKGITQANFLGDIIESHLNGCVVIQPESYEGPPKLDGPITGEERCVPEVESPVVTSPDDEEEWVYEKDGERYQEEMKDLKVLIDSGLVKKSQIVGRVIDGKLVTLSELKERRESSN